MTQLQLEQAASAAAPAPPRCIALPSGGTFTVANARVPTGCIQGPLPDSVPVCVDNLAHLDIEVVRGGGLRLGGTSAVGLHMPMPACL